MLARMPLHLNKQATTTIERVYEEIEKLSLPAAGVGSKSKKLIVGACCWNHWKWQWLVAMIIATKNSKLKVVGRSDSDQPADMMASYVSYRHVTILKSSTPILLEGAWEGEAMSSYCHRHQPSNSKLNAGVAMPSCCLVGEH
jgi:hypothetical protein